MKSFRGSTVRSHHLYLWAAFLAIAVAAGPLAPGVQANPGDEVVQRVLADPSGGIIVAAQAYDDTGTSDLLAVRYEESGSVDPFFGSAGMRRLDLGGSTESMNDATVQRDGKLVLVGHRREGTASREMTVVRLTTSGDLDPTFGSNGLSIPATLNNEELVPYAVTISRAGRIYIAGGCQCADGSLFVVRLQANGALDPAYGGGDGLVVFDYGPPTSNYAGRIRELALDSAGYLLLAAHSDCCGAGDGLLLMRLRADGQPDLTFGDNGRTYTVFPSPNLLPVGDHEPTGLLLTEQGIYVAGTYSYNSGCGSSCYANRGFVARFTQAGSLDTGFSDDGVVYTGQSEPNPPSGIYRVAGIGGMDGSIAVAGLSFNYSSEGDFALQRYSENGALLSETAANVGSWDQAESMAVDSQARAVVAGITINSGTGLDIALARYTSIGLLDTTFCQSGTVVTDISTGVLNSTSCLIPPPAPFPPPDSGGPEPGDPPAVIDVPDNGGCASPGDLSLDESNPPDWIAEASEATKGFLTAQALTALVNRRPHLALLLKAYKYASFIGGVIRIIDWGVEIKELAARWQDKPCRAAFIDDLADPDINPETAALLADLTGLSNGSSSWLSLTWTEKLDDANLRVAECELQHEGNPTAFCLSGGIVLDVGIPAIRKWWEI